MSAGNLVGAVMVSVLIGGLLLVMGKVVDIFVRVAGITLASGAYYQDGINGFNMMTGVFQVIGVIIIIAVWVNYALKEMSESSQEV